MMSVKLTGMQGRVWSMYHEQGLGHTAIARAINLRHPTTGKPYAEAVKKRLYRAVHRIIRAGAKPPATRPRLTRRPAYPHADYATAD